MGQARIRHDVAERQGRGVTLRSVIEWYARQDRRIEVAQCARIASACCAALDQLEQTTRRAPAGCRALSPDTIVILESGDIDPSELYLPSHLRLGDLDHQ